MNQSILSSTTKKLLGLAGLLFFSASAFTATIAPPPPPKLVYPAATGNPTVPQKSVNFQWSPQGGSYYYIVISQNQAFSGLKWVNNMWQCDGTCYSLKTNGTSYGKDMSLAGAQYYWKAIAFNAASGSWSPVSLFKTAAPPSFPAVDFNSNAYRSDNLFWKGKYAPQRFYSNGWKSQLGASKGNCTWYANGRLRQLGYTINLDKMGGNAATWSTAAKNSGIAVDSIPTVGAIAQSTANRSGYGSSGHVAVVEKINSDGTLLISESSYYTPGSSWDFEYRTRTVKQTEFNNYIHVSK